MDIVDNVAALKAEREGLERQLREHVDEAHAYTQKHLNENPQWPGQHVWKSILDDAIKQRARADALARQVEKVTAYRTRVWPHSRSPQNFAEDLSYQFATGLDAALSAKAGGVTY
jgi:hypothetical protein